MDEDNSFNNEELVTESAHIPKFFHFLKKSDIKMLIQLHIPLLEKPLTDLSRLEDERSLVYAVQGKAQLSDGHTYFKRAASQDEKAHQIKYSSFLLDNFTVKTAKGSSITVEGLHRTIVYLKKCTLVHYYLEDHVKYENPNLKTRISEEEKEVAQDALVQRSVKQASEYLKEKGYIISERQVRNQKKYVQSSLASNYGQKVQTDLSALAALQSASPYSLLTTGFDEKGKRKFRYFHVFRDNLDIYMSGCPNKHDSEEWEETALRLCDMTPLQRESEIDTLLGEFPNGVRFSSRAWVDTTFSVSDALITLVFGELSNFQNRMSKKNCCVVVSLMAHTTRDEENHHAHAEHLAKIVRSYYPNRVIPSITVDGESALEWYSQKLGAHHLRCDVHRAYNLKMKFGKMFTDHKRSIFGENTHGDFKLGLLGSFSGSEFDKKLQKLKGVLDDKLFAWLKKNRDSLVNHNSAGQKLVAGNFVVFNSTNALENFNKILKQLIRKSRPVEQLVKQLDVYCSESYQEFMNSISGNSTKIDCVFQNEFISSDTDGRCQLLKAKGFSVSDVYAWPLPPTLRKCLNRVKLEEIDKESEEFRCTKINENLFVVQHNSKPERIANIFRKNSTLTCSECPVKLPHTFCQHQISMLKSLTLSERSRELQNYDVLVKNMKLENLVRPNIRKFEGNKIGQRRGGKASSRNHIRTIRTVTDVTIFAGDDGNSEKDDTESFCKTVEITDPDSESSDLQLDRTLMSPHPAPESSSCSDPGSPIMASTRLSEGSAEKRRRNQSHENGTFLSDSDFADTSESVALRRSSRSKKPKKFEDFVETHQDLRKSEKFNGGQWYDNWKKSIYNDSSDDDNAGPSGL